MVDEIKLVYSTHKGIPDNETPDSLTKVASASQMPEISLAKINKANKHLTLQKWQRG